MTFYDDGEIMAVELVRRAGAEQESLDAMSTEMHQITMQVYADHGSDGIAGLVVALARWNATAFRKIAKDQGKTFGQFMDEWELSKLEQHGGVDDS